MGIPKRQFRKTIKSSNTTYFIGHYLHIRLFFIHRHQATFVVIRIAHSLNLVTNLVIISFFFQYKDSFSYIYIYTYIYIPYSFFNKNLQNASDNYAYHGSNCHNIYYFHKWCTDSCKNIYMLKFIFILKIRINIYICKWVTLEVVIKFSMIFTKEFWRIHTSFEIISANHGILLRQNQRNRHKRQPGVTTETWATQAWMGHLSP